MKTGTIAVLIVFLVIIIGGFYFSTKMIDDIKAFNENKSASSFSEKSAYGDVFVDSSIGDASILNPILSTDSASSDIHGLIFNGLVKYDKNLRLMGDLAEGWEISKDNLSVTFYLKKNIRWQDGLPFTAADVEFTFKKLTDPKTKSPYKSAYELVKKFEVLDDFTIQVTYGVPFAPALESWGMGILPKHLLENADINTAAFNSNPLGTGPFKFVDWNRGERIRLKSNEAYYDGRPFIDKVLYRIITDQATQLLELKSGGIDAMGLTPDMYVMLTKDPAFTSKYNIFKYNGFNYTYLGFNLNNPLFSDKNVRKAIACGINKKEIINGVLLGLGVEATGPFLPRSWAFNKDVRRTEYNPEKAKMLLKDAGWHDSDGDGILERNGKKFEFMLMTNQGNKPRELVTQMIQQNLKKLGIKVNIRIIAWSSFINEFVDKKKFDALVLGWQLVPDPDIYDIFHSSKTGEKEYNFVSYKNSEVDRLLIEGRTTYDLEKRRKAYNKIHEIIAEDLPYVFIYVPDSLVAMDKRFQNIKVEPAGIRYNFEKWFVPKEMQKYRNEIQK
ncbi:MAG: peptide-binding protein [Candidatus Firestonebacteria bacterium]